MVSKVCFTELDFEVLSKAKVEFYMNNPILGAKLILQLSTSFMPVAVNNCLAVLRGKGVLANMNAQSSAEISSQLDFDDDATARFFNAATSLGLVNVDVDRKYSVALNPPSFSSKGAEVLFWILRNEINTALVTKSRIDVRAIFETKENGRVVLDHAVQLGILKEEKDGVFFTPEFSPYLNPDSHLYMGLWIKNYDRIASRIFNEKYLIEALRTGETQWQSAFGANVRNPFDLVNVNINLFRDLMEGMHQANIAEGELFAKAIDFSNVNTVLDIGGASGALALSLAKTHPSIKDIDIYEFDKAVPMYRTMYDRYAGGVSYPIEFIEGDFFRDRDSEKLIGLAHSASYDLLSLGWILHDWKDQDALVILKKLRNYINPTGRLIIAEAILPDNRLGPNTLLDLTMLLQTGGRERTLGEYKSLLEQTGFRLSEVIETGGRRQLIVAIPVGF